MPFPEINLDDRTFESLFNEAKRRIPAYTPEWTDHNESDPGITLLQLFTWLQEMVLFRLNRVPDKNYLAFLRMIGMTAKLPSAAKADLTFKLSLKDSSKTITVGRGSRVQLAQPGEGGPVIFETDEDLNAAAVELAAMQVFDGAQFTLIQPANLGPGKSFQPFGSDPRQNAALYLGFSAAFPPGVTFKMRIYDGQGAAAAPIPSGKSQTDLLPVSGAWEYSIDDTQFQPLPGVLDSTLALSRSGWVQFKAPGVPGVAGDTPAAARKLGALVKAEDKPLYWFRFRIAQVLGEGYERTPLLEQVLVNTVSATNAVTEENELLGASNGRPNQTFRLAHSQILPLDPGVPGIIEVMESAAEDWKPWIEVSSLDRSARTDRHYVLDHSTGEITFGNGEHGKIPQWLQGDPSASQLADIPNIRASRYRWGGGGAGNAGAGTITSLQSPVPFVDSVTNVRPSVGGSDEETVQEAALRAPMELRTAGRAITPDDFRFLAENTPGAQVARAQAFPLLNPKYRVKRTSVTGDPAPEVPMPGTVTVVVVPKSDLAMPMPTEQTLQLVGDYLDQRRLITTELFIAPPRYRKVQIQVTVVADPSVASGSLALTLKQTLLNYFHPINGGSKNTGWVFGHTISFSETYRVILTTPGVVRVSGDVTTIVDDAIQPKCTDVQLEPDELAYSEDHVVTVIYA